MSFDIEGIYSKEANFSERAKENAVMVGLITLHAVVAPVVLVAGVTKNLSTRLSERAKYLGSYIPEPSQEPINVTEQTVYRLPNQLLSNHVEITNPVNPLISEALRSRL